MKQPKRYVTSHKTMSKGISHNRESFVKKAQAMMTYGMTTFIMITLLSGTIIRGTLKTPNSQLVTPISIKLQRPDGCD
jgi:hypothetical protein